jgi:hypothetical protein
MKTELEELKEISIAKIKVAYNRSIDLEATHTVLWNRSEKNYKIWLLITLILSITAAISIIFSLMPITLMAYRRYILLTDIFTVIIMFIVIWETIKMFTKRSRAHGHIVNDALQLREQSMNFLQYKLDNLDKQGYINELKSLEVQDLTVKEKSERFTKKISNKVKSSIYTKVEELERQGTKKYFINPEEIDSANEKLQKYTALRTCEAWIKFE